MKSDSSASSVLAIVTGFLLIHVIFSVSWALVVSLVVGISGLLSSYISRKIEYVWLQIAKILQFIVPNIVLGLVFFLVLFPISLLSKIFTKDPLMLSGRYDSFFIDVDKEMDKESFEKVW